MTTVVELALAVVLAAAYFWYRHRDRRLLRNGLFLVAAAWFLTSGVLSLLTTLDPRFGWVMVGAWALTPLLALVLALFLIGNGLTMLRREGHGLANLLSLLVGVALLALPVLAVALVLSGEVLLRGVGALLFLLCSYFGLVFVVFLVYSLVYSRNTPSAAPAAVVVLGSKLVDGHVPPLLRSRLEKALDVYRRGVDRGRPPLVIPSGGRGPDESRSEGAAMAEYLLEHGAAPEDVSPELEARNTEDNLVLSRAVQVAASRPGPVLVVTNNYHVLRAAVLARRIGTDAQVVGAPTAPYYIPSAFLREFVAILVEQRRVHLAFALPIVILTVPVVVAVSRMSGG